MIQKNAVAEPAQLCDERGPEASKKILQTKEDTRQQSKSVNAKTRVVNEFPESRLPERGIDFAVLQDGSLIDVVENPTDPDSTLLAIFKGGRIRFRKCFERGGQILVPMPRNTIGFSAMNLPAGIRPYRSTTRLFYTIRSLIGAAVDVSEPDGTILAAFVLYTWVADRLPVAVYLSIVGLPQSGKSTLLEILSLICRRPLLVSDISQAAVYRACSRLHPTLLVDEIDWHSSNGTSAMRQLLRAGTGRSSQVLRVRESSWSFGPKVFGSLEPSSDPALNSRCIEIAMAESNKRELVKPCDPRIVKFASQIREELLLFRFRHYQSIRPAVIPGAEELRPRARDLLASLAAPLKTNPCEARLLLQYFKYFHDPSSRESLSPRQDGLLAVLFELVHRRPGVPSVRIGGSGSLTEFTNILLAGHDEPASLTERAVGSMVTSLGFPNKQRTNQGWILWLDSLTRDRCHQLMKTHGNRYVRSTDLLEYSKDCPACQAFSGSH
jgi:hypothetical protein